MQTLTIPASIPKRKQACKSCRQRKKKCDAERPACALCKKWNIRCEYAIVAGNRHDHRASISDAEEPIWTMQHVAASSFTLEQAAGPLDFMRHPGLNFDLATSAMQSECPTSESGMQAEVLLSQQNILADMQLPSDGLLTELVELLFDKLGHMFPCFHRRRLLRQIQTGELQRASSLLLHAICCVAARYHADQTVRSRQKNWYEQAKLAYELTQRDPRPGLRTLQAVLILVFYGYTAGDFSSTWLFLGKAWRQAVSLGVNRMDADKGIQQQQHLRGGGGKIYGLESDDTTTTVEREEYRRTLWMLFIMDRNQAWPTGWPNAIPETAFKVDLPIADKTFQNMDQETEFWPENNAFFIRNLNHLIASSKATKDPMDVFHYVCITHVILGRTAELVHSLHDPPDTLEYAEECEKLNAHLVTFRLSLPRHVASVLEAHPDDRGHVVWLQVMLNTSAMILHYRCASGVPVANASSHFTLAVTAAQNIAYVVKTASRISIELLLSAHIGASLYVAACILVIQWRTTGDPSLKADIDLFSLVFESMNEVFVFLGLKFSLALEYDLQRSKESLEDLRNRGFKGFLSDCSKWSHVKEEVQRRGILIDIT